MAEDKEEEKKKPTKKLIRIGGEIIDARYIVKIKRVDRYDDKKMLMVHGVSINEDVPEFSLLKDYEILFNNYDHREEEMKTLEKKLLLLNIEII